MLSLQTVLNNVNHVDIAIDGADEIDGSMNLIKVRKTGFFLALAEVRVGLTFFGGGFLYSAGWWCRSHSREGEGMFHACANNHVET